MGTSHRAVQLSGPRSSIISEKSSSSTTTMGKGNNEGGFSQEQIDMYKECFKLMDVDKEEDGKKALEAEMFRHALAHFGDVFNKAEVDDVFNEFEVDDDGYIESKVVIGLFVAGGGEEKKEEEKKEKTPTPEPEEAPVDDGGKKKKKKKKAAK